MAKKSRKSSGFLQSGFGLALVAFAVLAVGYFLYSGHQKGVLGTSTRTTSTSQKCGWWVTKLSVYGYLKSNKTYTKADVVCQDKKIFTGLTDSNGKTIGAWGVSAAAWCKNYSKCQSLANPPLP
jgi:hypothetical protein